jgi:hypothetical protein
LFSENLVKVLFLAEGFDSKKSEKESEMEENLHLQIDLKHRE